MRTLPERGAGHEPRRRRLLVDGDPDRRVGRGREPEEETRTRRGVSYLNAPANSTARTQAHPSYMGERLLDGKHMSADAGGGSLAAGATIAGSTLGGSANEDPNSDSAFVDRPSSGS